MNPELAKKKELLESQQQELQYKVAALKANDTGELNHQIAKITLAIIKLEDERKELLSVLLKHGNEIHTCLEDLRKVRSELAGISLAEFTDNLRKN